MENNHEHLFTTYVNPKELTKSSGWIFLLNWFTVPEKYSWLDKLTSIPLA